MKQRKLYTKILLSFMTILLITGISVFLLFHLAVHKLVDDNYEVAVKAVNRLCLSLEEEVRLDPDWALAKNRLTYNLLSTLNFIFDIKFWIVGADNNLLLKSFPDPLPLTSDFVVDTRIEDITFLVKRWHRFILEEYYVRAPLNLGPNRPAELHILILREINPHHHYYIVLGLVEIFLLVALLVFPVTRQITGPVKKLQHSALRIAHGDFGHRAEATGQDEIGDLARAFNHMTDHLEQMIRSARELTANVSHELRSPLARIRIAGELSREKLKNRDPRGAERHLETIAKEIDHMDRLIGRLLFLSKLDLKETPLAYAEFDLVELISTLVKQQELILFGRKLEFCLDLPDRAKFFGDPEALGTALFNVIDNALKYTPEPGRIELKLVYEAGYYIIEAANTCAGLTETDPQDVFQAFYRADGLKVSGSGLGLAITRKVIEKHGGLISARIVPGLFSLEIKLPAGQS